MSGGPYSLTVTGREWLNANDRGGWQRRHRLSREWRNSSAWVARAVRLPTVARVHITATAVVRDGRRRDPANLAPTAKAVVDGLVDAGLIQDDDSKHLDGPDMRVRVDPSVAGPTLELRIEVVS